MIISFLRTVLLYIVILSSVRLMGKRQISELQTSELVVTLLISDIAAIPMQDNRPAAGQRIYSHRRTGYVRNRGFRIYAEKRQVPPPDLR